MPSYSRTPSTSYTPPSSVVPSTSYQPPASLAPAPSSKPLAPYTNSNSTYPASSTPTTRTLAPQPPAERLPNKFTPTPARQIDIKFNNGLRLVGEMIGYGEGWIQVRVEGGKAYKIRLLMLTKDSVAGLTRQLVASTGGH